MIWFRRRYGIATTGGHSRSSKRCSTGCMARVPLTGDYPCVSSLYKCSCNFNAASHKSSGTFPEADQARGRQVVRAEPMSTLDTELNDFGAQLAMLHSHAADCDG